VNGVVSTTRSLFGYVGETDVWTDAVAAHNVLLCAFSSSSLVDNAATAHEVKLYATCEEFTLHADFTVAPITAIQNSAFTKEAYAVSSVDYISCEYTITVPNETSFPGKTRCLCQVQSLFHRMFGCCQHYFQPSHIVR
jgi:hypothetical protein